MTEFYVELPMKLQSKSNYRRSAATKKRWDELVLFERAVAAIVAAEVPDDWDLGDPAAPIDDRPIVAMVISAHSRYDAANFSKSIADAVQGVVYIDDKSLRYPVAESRWEKNAKTVIGFALLPPRCPVATARDATARLLAGLPS